MLGGYNASAERRSEIDRSINVLPWRGGPWGNKWGNMPHRFQPISADLDPAENRLKLRST
jgi:hypothetical protein